MYDAAIDDCRLPFGVSGKLADDGLVLCDRETESEWKQSTGECVAGVACGARLRVRRRHVLPGCAPLADPHPRVTFGATVGAIVVVAVNPTEIRR